MLPNMTISVRVPVFSQVPVDWVSLTWSGAVMIVIRGISIDGFVKS